MTTYSRNTTRAIKAYGEKTCCEAYKCHAGDGEGSGTVAGYFDLTISQADAAINAGREIHQAAIAIIEEAYADRANKLNIDRSDLAVDAHANCKHLRCVVGTNAYRETFEASIEGIIEEQESLACKATATAAPTAESLGITEKSLAVFIEYANDAGNWSGSPLVGGNVGGGKEERGNLTQLKQVGLITTQVDEGNTWLYFTKAGRDLGAALGIELN